MEIIHPYRYRSAPNDYFMRIEQGYVITRPIVIPLPELANVSRGKCETQGGLATLSPYGDLALYPGFFWNGSNASIDSVTGILAACAHDALCEMVHRVPRKVRLFSRRQADKVYFRIMLAQGTPGFRARYHWLGVRIGALLSIFKAIVIIAALIQPGCIKINIDKWVHRGQYVTVGTNDVPATINIDNLQEGGSANFEDITGAKVK